MRREKRDANEPAIVRALEAAGRSVERLPGGDGRPDLLVGWGSLYVVLLEVKAPKAPLEDNQVEWHNRWKGLPVIVVRSPEDALRACGVPV